MPTYILYDKATLEGIASLQATDKTTWIIDVESSDGSEKREGVYISKNEEIDMEGSRGKTHFVVKFKGANKQVRRPPTCWLAHVIATATPASAACCIECTF